MSEGIDSRWLKDNEDCPSEKREWFDATEAYWEEEFYRRPSSPAKKLAVERLQTSRDASRIAMLIAYNLEDLI